MSRQKSRREIGSTPLVGSSRKTTRGSWRTAQARARRCFQPPGSSPVSRSSLPSRPAMRSAQRLALAGRRPPQAVDAAEEAQVLGDGEVVVEAEALAHVPDPPLHALGVLRDVHAEHEAGAGGRPEQPAQHADRRGLAGAVRAEEAEDLALVHGERDPVHGLEGPEVLAQLADLDGCRHPSPTARSRPAAARRRTARASVRARAARSCATSASRSSDDGMTPSR